MTAMSVESICADVGITIIPCNQTGGPCKTKAANVLRRIMAQHGEGHTILVLRTIVESEGNEAMLTEPVLHGVSDVLLAHPGWGERGLAWLEAFDDISLKELAAKAKANRRACPSRFAIATMLHSRLSPLFDPPPKVRRAYAAREVSPIGEC